ncbi:hypothetical protein DERP_014642 [Dermatophagoides pteronyssinus]|uniref:Uncharacterized protein n=1 Tax=Dermatophagoides pteronyssinus TaxID=6956 RepID=A0ABQ8IU20_DERPT|nr:hypothetical protein DERP_014642 [Dermatophagoides pteronyssinus]
MVVIRITINENGMSCIKMRAGHYVQFFSKIIFFEQNLRSLRMFIKVPTIQEMFDNEPWPLNIVENYGIVDLDSTWFNYIASKIILANELLNDPRENLTVADYGQILSARYEWYEPAFGY